MTKRWAWRIALCSLLMLLALWSGWSTVWVGVHHAPLAAGLALATLPLLIGLYGLLRRRRTTVIWLGLTSLLYFVHGIVSLYAQQPAHPALAAVETIISLFLFLGTFLWLRQTPH
jgi:uncharacterized membrane protein